MARTAFAPTHRLGAPIKYVPAGDDAWDHDVMAKAWEPGREHDGHSLDPLYHYLLGDTRFDLGATELRELIEATKCLDTKAAEVWTLRALPPEQRIAVDDLLRSGRSVDAKVSAFVHGVMRLEGASNPEGEALATVIEGLPTKRARAEQTSLLEAVCKYAYQIIDEIGQAVIIASRDLSEAEKKS